MSTTRQVEPEKHTHGPSSEHDWSIHSINIHGVFFQRWCEKVVANSNSWKLTSTNYPVEFPPPNGPFRGRESALDIRAELRQENQLLTLLIECKKNNPGFINWVFFPKHPLPKMARVAIREIENLPRSNREVGWDVRASVKSINSAIPVTDDAREIRSSYKTYKGGDKTKTSNRSISEAAHQIALATQAIALEEWKFSRALGGASTAPVMAYRKQRFLPAIVTSARIFTCDFDPTDVSPATGEIPYEKARLNEWPYILYEYALPPHLQNAPEDLVDTLTRNSIDLFTRMQIMVVHSAKLTEVLDDLATKSSQFWG